MEISIKTEELRKKSIFIATPMYGGMNHGMYMKACLDLQGMCMQYGVATKFSFLFNESLITRARNYLVDEFLSRSDCTHLLFLDSDINFDPRDVIALLALDKDVIGGPYPKKAIKWKNIKTGMQKNPNMEPQQLEKLAGDFVFNPVKGTAQFSVTEPLEVMEIGTGFMMVKREVFAKFAEAYPHLNYKPDHVGQAHFDGTRYIHAYFDTVIDKGYTFEDAHQLLQRAAKGEDVESEAKKLLDKEKEASHRYLSEDYMFCQWWRNIGGKIYLCPWMKTSHIGTYHFTGDMPAIANFVGEM
jgi:hypothetical protein